PGSASVVQSVTSSVNGIGYSGMGYTTSGVKMVPLAAKGSKNFVEASPANAAAGTYPLTRYLYIYVNKKPNQPLAPLENEFIKMVLSKTGQQVVIKDGYIPLPAKVVDKLLTTLK
ncbi:MAG: PstS family phosphate ABC transporter substrate-binding protein, partial [Gammaproteobacteria bacterium]